MQHITLAQYERQRIARMKLLDADTRREIERDLDATCERVGYAQRPKRTAKEFDALKAAGYTEVSGRTLYEGRSGTSNGEPTWRDVWLLPCQVRGRRVLWDVRLVLEHEMIIGNLRALGKLASAA